MGILHGVILYELTNIFFYAWRQPLFYFIHLFHRRLGWRELVPEGTVSVPKPMQKGHIGMPCCLREVQERGWTWKPLCPKSLFFLFFHRLNVEAVPKAQQPVLITDCHEGGCAPVLLFQHRMTWASLFSLLPSPPCSDPYRAPSIPASDNINIHCRSRSGPFRAFTHPTEWQLLKRTVTRVSEPGDELQRIWQLQTEWMQQCSLCPFKTHK